LHGCTALVWNEDWQQLQEFGEAFFLVRKPLPRLGMAASALQALAPVLLLHLRPCSDADLFTGYGFVLCRFSKPKAYLKFSFNAIIAPYKDITALMIRVAPFKNATLTDAEAKLTLGMAVEEMERP